MVVPLGAIQRVDVIGTSPIMLFKLAATITLMNGIFNPLKLLNFIIVSFVGLAFKSFNMRLKSVLYQVVFKRRLLYAWFCSWKILSSVLRLSIRGVNAFYFANFFLLFSSKCSSQCRFTPMYFTCLLINFKFCQVVVSDTCPLCKSSLLW